MKRALVTGGSGFIGHYLANELNNKGYTVTVIDKSYNLKEYLHPNINFVLQDIRTDLIDEEFDYVYHLAALIDMTESYRQPQAYMSTNIWGTYNILQSFRKARFINISSAAAAEVKSIYGITKKCSEHFINIHKEFINIRLMKVFGERQVCLKRIIPYFMYSIKHGEQALICGNGQSTRDFIYIIDTVDELIKIGESSERGTRDLGYGTAITVLDLYKLLCELAKKHPNYKLIKSRRGSIKSACASNTIKEPKIGFTEGLRRTVRWYLTNKDF